MAYNSLYDYYAANGGWNTWNSAKRQADAKAAGIQNYTGSADQNAALLKYLQNPTPTVQQSVAPQNIVTQNNTSTPQTQTVQTIASTANINPYQEYKQPELPKIGADFYKQYQSQINESYNPTDLWNKVVKDTTGLYADAPNKAALFNYSFTGKDGAAYKLDANGNPIRTTSAVSTYTDPKIAELQQQVKDLVLQSGYSEEQANQIISQGTSGVAAVQEILNGGKSGTGDVAKASTILSADQLKNLSSTFKAGNTSSSVSSKDFMDSITTLLNTQASNSSQMLTNYMQNQQNYNQALAQQETTNGVDTYAKNIQDWTTQLSTLKGQFDQQNLMLADQAIPMPTIVGQQNMLAQQTNAKMGTLATMIQAAQGNMNLAREMAKKTVEAKYGDQTQQLQNIQLMLQANQSELSRQDQKTSQILQLALNLRQETLGAEKAEQEKILNIAAEMASNGADQDTVSVITNASSASEAIRLAAASGYLSEKQIAGQLSEGQISAASSLRKDYESASSEFYNAREGYVRLVAAGNNPSPAGDLALIFNYMKILDPRSIVRESEFQAAAATGNLPQQVQAQYEKVVSGQRLTETQRADFINRGKVLFDAQNKQQRVVYGEFSNRADMLGIPKELVVRSTDASLSGGGGSSGYAPENDVVSQNNIDISDINFLM